MLNAVVTEIPPKLEPVTVDTFEYVAATDRPSEATAAVRPVRVCLPVVRCSSA